MKRIDTLTSIRFFMMMLIVFSHFEFLQRFDESGFVYKHFLANAYFSVDFFFILSGFGMMYSYIGKKQTIDRISFGNSFTFAVRHVKKLYKLYAITMILAVPLYCFYEVKARGIPLENLFFVELKKFIVCVPLLQSSLGLHGYSHAFNGVSWFLSSLFVCYFMSPFFLKYLGKIRMRKMTLFILGLNIILLFFIRIVFKKIELNTVYDDLVYGSPYCRIFYVLLGMNLAKLYVLSKDFLYRFVGNFLEICCVLLGVIFVFGKNALAEEWSYNAYLSVIICCLIIFVFSFQNGFVSQFLQRRRVKALGEMSMYIFLIHYPVRAYLDAFFRFAGFKDSQCFGMINVIFTLIFTLLMSNYLLNYRNTHA